jgi:hypothetical protein
MASCAPSEAKAFRVARRRRHEALLADGFIGAHAHQQHARRGHAGHAAQQQGRAGLAGDVARLDGGGDVAVRIEGFAASDSFLFSNTATAMQPDLAAASVFFVSNAFMLKSI